MRMVVSKMKSDAKRLIEKCEKLLYIEPQKVIKYSQACYDIALKNHDYENLSKSAYYAGMSYYYMGQLEVAYKWFYKGEKISEYQGLDKEIRADIKSGIGLIYRDMGEIDNALYYFYLGIETCKENEKSATLGKIYNNMSIIFSDLKDYEQANKYLEKAEEIFSGKMKPMFQSIMELNMGEVYAFQGRYKDAKERIEKGLTIARKNNIKYAYIHALITYGKYYREREEYDNSIRYIKKAGAEAINEKNKSLYISSKIELINSLICAKKLEYAKKELLELEQIGDIKTKKAELRDASKQLAEIYYADGEYDIAAQYLKKAIKVNNKIDKSLKKARINFINEKMKISDIKNENSELEKVNKNLRQLNAVCKKIASAEDVFNILVESYNNIESIIGNDDFQLFLYEKDKKQLRGVQKKEAGFSFKAYENPINNWMMNTKELTVLNTLQNNSIEYIKEVTGNKKEAVGLVYLPLLVEDEIIGAICLYDYEGKNFSEYIKDVLDILASYIAVALDNANNIEKMNETYKKLDIASKLDPLTRVPNRRYFQMHLDKRWEDIKSKKEILSIALIDIDHFKKYNDTCGHLEGDETLKIVAKTIEKCIRKEIDFLARYGGEEFIVASIKRTEEEMMIFAEEIRAAVENVGTKCTCDEKLKKVTVSIGVVSETVEGNTRIEEITNKADEALYKAKDDGRNRVEKYKNK